MDLIAHTVPAVEDCTMGTAGQQDPDSKLCMIDR